MDGISWLSYVYPIYILDVKKVRHTKTRYLDDAGEGVKERPAVGGRNPP